MNRDGDDRAQERAREIHRRLILQSRSLLEPATWLLSGTAVLLGAISLWFARPARALIWVGLVVLAHLAFYGIALWSQRRPTGIRLRSRHVFAGLLGALGLAWGSMPWIAGSTTDSGWVLLALALTIVMIAAGAMAVRTPVVKGAFQGTLLLVGGAGLVILGGRPAAAATTLMVAAFVADQWIGLIARRVMVANIGTILDNEQLASDLQVVNAELSHAVKHDALTDLPNRSQFEKAVADCAGPDGEVCVGFLDIDRFKLINDSHGHSGGDELLIKVAERLRAAMRANDFVSREGGDEFVMVMRDIATRVQAVNAGERVLHAFEEPFLVGDRYQRVTASLGIACGPASDAAELLRFADSALYEAKGRGRDRCYVFDEGLRERSQAKVRVEQDLRSAIENGEVTGWFQPIIDLENGAYLGVECLARWVDDRFEETADFMSVAGGLGLIVGATKAAIEPIGPLLDLFASEGADFNGELQPRLAINVPPRHAAEMIAYVRDQFGKTAFPHLTFELTETEMIGDLSEVVAAIESARALGAHVVLDDFGTAYSALSLLVELPIDGVKIDLSFVADIENDHVSQAIVSGVVEVSKYLELSVIAEGVESAAQLLTLRELGVRRAQGFLFSRAVPIDAALADAATSDWLAATGL